MKQAFKIIDYTERYKSIMQFNKNKNIPIHRWYPFVEGYSKEFIQGILDELDYTPECVLEPFSGSGTTSVEMQDKGIKCISFEVSPFMHLLSTVKLRRDYNDTAFLNFVQQIQAELKEPIRNIRKIVPLPFGDTIVKNDKVNKWNFNDPVMNALLDIKNAIAKVNDKKYQELFNIALASILLDVSNVFRNGKCLSYKKDWSNKIRFKRKDVHTFFFEKLNTIFIDDIKTLTEDRNDKTDVNNYDLCYKGDVRENITKVNDNSIDLIITSPPYLNSRDYTDIYMLELKILGLVNSYDELRALRNQTIRSHVQVKYANLELLKINKLEEVVQQIESNAGELWNNGLINMIKGYFIDMDYLFLQFKRKMKSGKMAYVNVANSAYYGVEILVDEIICEIAEKHGFTTIEIRKARDLKTSSQQSKQIKSLRESVIVLKS
ncbi:DNA modification methylase [Xenorhabdus sp. 42]|uniref:hypothetical protein n=1 Tax=Xenorhabdus szentirmaii TaxID=290112 RepID=UPI001984B0FA|nr:MULTISPECIES: hypothetical protein [unclassified Xenorhabdus]MBD2792593.1 DNA modification methylase [Xenorhabdus sp. CUL]MBD2822456.1 DNA modification methylase [Xenorhabdus sp. 42]